MSRVIEPSDKLLDLVYDAATDKALWTPALKQFAEMTGSVGSFVFGLEIKDSFHPFLFNGGLSEEAHRVYAERHVSNPISDHMNTRPMGVLVRSDEIIALADLRRTAFYDEVLRPQDIDHVCNIGFFAKDDFRVGFTICRSGRLGAYGADELRLLSQFYSHMKRSLFLGFRLDAYRALQSAATHVLDRLSAGVILIDRAAKAVFVNAAARAMTAAGGALILRGGALTAPPASAAKLNNLIQAALRGLPAASMSIPHPHDGRLMTVLVTSVRSRDLDRFTRLGLKDAAAALFIMDPAQPLDVPAAWIMDAYGLTLSEARVALCAASGAPVQQTAQRLNVSPNTVKTHLRNIFAKTGASRQSDLAAMLTSVALVARGPAQN